MKKVTKWLFLLATLCCISCANSIIEIPADAKYVATATYFGHEKDEPPYIISFHKNWDACEQAANKWARNEKKDSDKKFNYGCMGVKYLKDDYPNSYRVVN